MSSFSPNKQCKKQLVRGQLEKGKLKKIISCEKDAAQAHSNGPLQCE